MDFRAALWGYTRKMGLREYVSEQLVGDLEYHPRLGLVYLGLATGALCCWIFGPFDDIFATIPLVCAGGGLTLLLKGIFLLRRSSEGLALSATELEQLSDPSNRKALPPIPVVAGLIVQDFGAGVLLLGVVVLRLIQNVDKSRDIGPTWPVALSGALLFGIGWAIRSLSSSLLARK